MNETILRILTEAGEQGMSLQKLILHVYNASNSFFHPVDLDEVRMRVVQFLRTNSRYPSSLVEHTQRGIYRLNPNSDRARQLLLSFEETAEDTADTAPDAPLGPSLFD